MIDLSGFVEEALAIVDGAETAPGVYRRHSGRFGTGGGPDPYGAADAANVLYTLGRFPRDEAVRKAAVDGINALQGEDGIWRETTHHPIHTTAHCVAALELYDAPPARPLAGLATLTAPGAMEAFLDELPWRDNPWRASHQGAGLFAALVLAGEVSAEWQARYVAWLTRNADPETGFWRRGAVGPVEHSGTATLFPHLAGSFHYLFNLEYLRAPLPYPERMIDSCLTLWAEDRFPIGRSVGYAEIDWVFCLNRASRQTAHRYDEGREALHAMEARYTDYLLSLDPREDEGLCDLHLLFGVVCALAELQAALPGTIATPRPLRLVLDRRPFI